MSKILIVEDEAKIARFLELELKHEGYEVVHAADGRTGLEMALEKDVDLVLLDIMLPALSGIEVCRRVRMESQVPIIMLTAKDDVMDKVAGLDMGADDYIAKPFGMTELTSRVRAVLRRYEKTNKSKEYKIGDLYVNPEKHIIEVAGKEVNLSFKEYSLLMVLLEAEGNVVSRDALLTRVWGEFYDESRTLHPDLP